MRRGAMMADAFEGLSERAQAALGLLLLASGLVCAAFSLDRWRSAGPAFAGRHRLADLLVRATLGAVLLQPLGIAAWALTRRNVWGLASLGALFAVSASAFVATWSWRRHPSVTRGLLRGGFAGVPRIAALPELPSENPEPGCMTPLDAEVFARFPEASHYHRIGFGPTAVGEIDVLVLWGEKEDTARVVAFLPRPLCFDWEIRAGGDGSSPCPRLGPQFSMRTSDEAAAQAILAKDEVPAALTALATGSADAGLSASHVTAEVGGVAGMLEAPVASVTVLAARVVVQVSQRAAEVGLLRA